MISVRKVVNKGNIVKLEDGGGYIINIAAQKKSRFAERSDLNSSKLKWFLRRTSLRVKARVSAGLDPN